MSDDMPPKGVTPRSGLTVKLPEHAPGPKIVTLHDARVDDIPAMLRRCAQSIDDGERGVPFAMAAVMVDASGTPTVWGWGKVDTELTAIGLFTLGAHYLTQNKVERG